MRTSAASGYAIQRAFDASKRAIELMVAARIVMQCALRAAKLLEPAGRATGALFWCPVAQRPRRVYGG